MMSNEGNPYDGLETGDPCPNCETGLVLEGFVFKCPECGWDNI